MSCIIPFALLDEIFDAGDDDAFPDATSCDVSMVSAKIKEL